MSMQNAKKAVAQAALDALEDRLSAGMVLGIGTGTTTNCFIELLAACRHRFDGAVATSSATTLKLKEQAIRVFDLNEVSLEIYVDGADEADPALRLIKGGGGALTLEKIVASVAREFICIADTSKFVSRLGTFPLPVEVLPQARALVSHRLTAMGGKPALRTGYTTTHGNQILTVTGLEFSDPEALETRINDIPGVICCGIFAHRHADVLYLGNAQGDVNTLTRPDD